MPLHFSPRNTLTLCLTSLMLLSACDKMVDGSNAAAEVTGKTLNDAASTWRDALTIHPAAKPQAPQTRYCYKMMTDIVCYDSAQPSLTAKLVGYQDGTNVSWVQPGGGSLGASGGAPVAFLQPDPHASKPDILSVSPAIEGTPVNVSATNGEIQSVNLPSH